jgi:endonuclease YncB( thermonuclease family)
MPDPLPVPCRALDRVHHGNARAGRFVPLRTASQVRFAGPAGAVAGKSRVIDGDTLDVGSRRIRLAGIDAPEREQQCIDAAKQPTACGKTSRREHGIEYAIRT